MKSYSKKVYRTLILGLAILAIALLVYLVYPKYQVNTVRISEDWVLITRVNTLTGQVTTEKEYTGTSKYGKYLDD